MNFKLLRLPILILFVFFSRAAFAQCEYTLNMYDTFGDGWFGGTLVISNGTNVQTYTLDNFNDDGLDSTLIFTVTVGEPLSIFWTPGFFGNNECSFSVLDYSGAIVYEDSNPATGELYAGTATCPSCLIPGNIRIENIYDTRVKLRWTPWSVSPGIGWYVIYGPTGFVPGPGVGDTLHVTTPKATLTGLQKKTGYDYYLLQDCGGGDFSALAGPFSFETYWTNDVGVSAVLTPLSGCDLGLEKVTILLSNFGSNPQSLLPFSYSVDGVSAGVPQPQDGFYTGVLGKDSSEVVEFETMFDFSEPGEHIIAVWTDMSGDEDHTNDTSFYYITNRIEVPYSQNFEKWDGAWYVDTSSTNSSWAFGTPAKLAIPNAASGVNAWVTNLSGNYNALEQSYLTSPCFDFSAVTQLPVIEFSLATQSELEFDGCYLEMTKDDGATWTKIGALGEGYNWYNSVNTFGTNGDVWSGSTNGWVLARHQLPGVLGQSSVRLRFVFFSDDFVNQGGTGIDDIHIFIPKQKDLAGLTIKTANEANLCGSQTDKVSFTHTNFGTAPQAQYKLAYSVNGGTPVVETVTVGILQPDEINTYTFTATFDSRDQVSVVKCWTQLIGEQLPGNDTATYTIDHRPLPVPFQQNFEAANIPPAGWAVTNGFVTNTHNNISNVMAVNMYSGSQTFSWDTPRYGVVSAGDSLYFDYRITNWSAGTDPTILSTDTKIDVQVSGDCGASFVTLYTINSTNHTPSVNLKTVKVSLDQFAGSSVVVRFLGDWGAGDFWFDLDNVNLRACAPDMDLSADVVPSSATQNTGSATVSVGLGNPPYTYLWSNGATTQTVNNLPAGDVIVTVTDAIGCSDVLTVSVGISATGEIEGVSALSLQPNPTNDVATLYVRFDRPVDAGVQLLDLLGRVLWENHSSNTTDLKEAINMAQMPDGLYFVRLTVNGQVITKKLVKQQ